MLEQTPSVLVLLVFLLHGIPDSAYQGQVMFQDVSDRIYLVGVPSLLRSGFSIRLLSHGCMIVEECP